MTREMKFQYHLEMVIWESLPPDVPVAGSEVERLAAEATPEQHEAAYQRALVRCPLLLEDERRPA